MILLIQRGYYYFYQFYTRLFMHPVQEALGVSVLERRVTMLSLELSPLTSLPLFVNPKHYSVLLSFAGANSAPQKSKV